MDKTSREVFEEKKKALATGDEAVAKQVSEGKDIMSILSESCHPVLHQHLINESSLVRANTLAEDADRLPENELLGQIKFVLIDLNSIHVPIFPPPSLTAPLSTQGWTRPRMYWHGYYIFSHSIYRYNQD
jgi:hypothetical protein